MSDNNRTRQYKIPLYVIYLIELVAICLSILSVVYLHGLHHPVVQSYAPVTTVHKPTPIHKTSSNYALPVRLQIPKLQIDSTVIYVGLTKDGNMSVPTNVIDAGWYKYSALPGNTGTAVIAGHLDGLRGEPGVFSALDKLAQGDTVTVTESNGSHVSFIVRETRSYDQTAQPKEVFSSDSGSHLNLITCTGSWDSAERQFSKRLVVFADKAQ